MYDDPRVAVGPGVLPEFARKAQCEGKKQGIPKRRQVSEVTVVHSGVKQSCVPWCTQDERGQPKALIATFVFAAEIGRTPFQLSRKIVARWF